MAQHTDKWRKRKHYKWGQENCSWDKATVQKRQERVENELKEKLQEKQKKVERTKRIKFESLVHVSTGRGRGRGGGWRLRKVFSKSWNKLKTTKKALLAQIKFHKNVLKSKGPKKLYQESSNNKKHTIDELKQNLMEILTISNCNDNEETSKGFFNTLLTVKTCLRQPIKQYCIRKSYPAILRFVYWSTKCDPFLVTTQGINKVLLKNWTVC